MAPEERYEYLVRRSNMKREFERILKEAHARWRAMPAVPEYYDEYYFGWKTFLLACLLCGTCTWACAYMCCGPEAQKLPNNGWITLHDKRHKVRYHRAPMPPELSEMLRRKEVMDVVDAALHGNGAASFLASKAVPWSR
jgi:hypothetical protein